MKYLLGVSAALLVGTAPIQFAVAKDSPADLVKAAVTAEGGVDALKSLKGLAIKGEAKHWEPGQSLKAGGEPRFLGDTTFTATIDLGAGAARLDLDRAMKYPAVEQLKYTEVITPTLGFVTTDKGSTAASGVRLAAQLRELGRASPTLLLRAMDNAKNITAADNQKLGKATLPAINFAEGATKFTILFDPKTHLPAAIRTRDDDNISGDSNYDLVLARLEAGERRAGRAHADLQSQRRPGRQGHLHRRQGEPGDRRRRLHPDRRGEGRRQGPGDRRRAVPVGAAPHRARPLSRLPIRCSIRRTRRPRWSTSVPTWRRS